MFNKFNARKWFTIILTFSIMLMAAGCQKNTALAPTKDKSETAASETTLVVSAAASLKEVLNELAEVYAKDHPEHHVTFNFGGSGVLAQQIEQGAEVDVFISASSKLMKGLEAQALLVDGSAQVLLKNKLVLVVPKDGSEKMGSLESLKDDKIKTIAVGEAKTVPAGQYALEALDHLGLTEPLKEKFVFGKDVKEVLTWVETGNVDAGLVYLTDAMASEKVTIATEVPEDAHSPIVYPLGVIKNSKNPEAAEAFTAFLNSETAKAIFEKYGFKTNIE